MQENRQNIRRACLLSQGSKVIQQYENNGAKNYKRKRLANDLARVAIAKSRFVRFSIKRENEYGFIEGVFVINLKEGLFDRQEIARINVLTGLGVEDYIIQVHQNHPAVSRALNRLLPEQNYDFDSVTVFGEGIREKGKNISSAQLNIVII